MSEGIPCDWGNLPEFATKKKAAAAGVVLDIVPAGAVMPRSWTCVIPGKPTPKGNSKKIVRMGRFAKLVAEPHVVAAESNAKAIAWSQRPPVLFDGPVVVDVDFVFAIPSSRATGKGAKRLHVGDPHVQRPDRGNLLKMLEDVLESVAYSDDCRVVDGRVRKLWGLVDETRVTVRGAP